jgi:VCBS repeat-containing protein
VTTVTLNVAAVNDAPLAGNDSFTASQDVPRTVSATGVLNNDSDPDGTTPTAVNATEPANGAVTLGSDGSFTYTPSAGFSGQDSFTYQASDGTQQSTATVTLNIHSYGSAPEAHRPPQSRRPKVHACSKKSLIRVVSSV